MMFQSFREWLTKKPKETRSPSPTSDEQTEKMGQLLTEIKVESEKMSKNINQLEKSDLLRSLVISMNRGNR